MWCFYGGFSMYTHGAGGIISAQSGDDTAEDRLKGRLIIPRCGWQRPDERIDHVSMASDAVVVMRWLSDRMKIGRTRSTTA